MYIPKRYGDSKIETCPFCSRQSTTVNVQSIPVCAEHKKSKLGEMSCVCGDELEVKGGKYGIFFLCMKCGPQNMKKVFETNVVKVVPAAHEPGHSGKEKPFIQRSEKERTQPMIKSDDPMYFD